MRWNATCTLIAKDYESDSEGVMKPTEVPTEVFCNERSVGAHTWSSMYEIGMSPDAALQVRSCDYDGQRDVIYDGEWYSIEWAKAEGETTVLTLRHQQSDSQEVPGYGETAPSDDGSDADQP